VAAIGTHAELMDVSPAYRNIFARYETVGGRTLPAAGDGRERDTG
jgi:hypothetical protein